jgi:hypothetical protein
MKVRTEMMPKFLEKKADPLHRLPLQILKNQAWVRRGSVLMSFFLRVLLLQENAPGEPSAPNPSEVEIFDALDS